MYHADKLLDRVAHTVPVFKVETHAATGMVQTRQNNDKNIRGDS